jgi:hypothetical protein
LPRVRRQRGISSPSTLSDGAWFRAVLVQQPGGQGPMSDAFNMSMRKFLKQVGVTSQQAIEDGLRRAGATPGQSFEAKVVLTVEGLDIDHVVTGTIRGDGA